MHEKSEIVNFIKDYNFANNSILLVGLESVITAGIIGIVKKDIGWGIGSFIIILLLYGFPVIAGVFSLIFSLLEASIIGVILTQFTSTEWSFFIAIVLFMLFLSMHLVFGNVELESLGYSLVIFDGLIISGCLYFLYKNLFLSIAVFCILFVMIFLPVLRIVEAVILTIGTTFIIYVLIGDSLKSPYNIFVSIFTFLFTGIAYLYAYLGIDYIGILHSLKSSKYRQEQEKEIADIKNTVYSKFPELEKKYYYFITVMCHTEFEKVQFQYDWNNYIEYLYESSVYISFNQYFDKEKLYRTSFYNRDFAEKTVGNDEEYVKQEQEQQESFEKDTSTQWFVGVKSLDELKKRYHELLKIYHPDNQAGDTEISKQIKEEYEKLQKMFHH